MSDKQGEVVVDDLPPLDEPEEVIEEMPPLDEPEEEIEEMPPLDEPEEVIEEMPPLDEPEEVIEEMPPVDEPEEFEEMPPVDEPEEEIEEMPPTEEPVEVVEAIPVPEEEDDNNPLAPPVNKGTTKAPPGQLTEKTPGFYTEDDIKFYNNPENYQHEEIEHTLAEEHITGNENVGQGKMKQRVKVRLEADEKAHQMAPQLKDTNYDAAYEKGNKEYGDIEYLNEGHGTVLVQEQAEDNNKRLQNHDFYDQGYTGRKKEDFGKENQKNYDYKRGIRRRKMDAPALVKHVEPARPKRRLPAKKKKNKKKKKKKLMEFGTEEHPLRMARKDGEFLCDCRA
jgi:hypothetical protein